MTPEQWSRKMLIDACDRVLKTKEEVRSGFWESRVHRDCFIVAGALKAILEDPRTQEVPSTGEESEKS